MEPRCRRLLPLLACLVLAACAGSPASPAPTTLEVPSRTLQSPQGDLFGLAWLANGWIVTDYRADPKAIFGNSRLWHFQADGSDFAEIPLPDDATCRLLGAFRPVALADGGLGFDRECIRGIDRTDASLERLDPATGAVSVLAPVATDVGASGLASLGWSPTLGRGLASIGSGICQGIEWIDAAGPRPIDLVVADGNALFNLADEFKLTVGEHCDKTGHADLPAISPLDQRVAFFASPGSVGRDGFDRLDVPSNLYVADKDLNRADIVVRAVGLQGALAWSPDGRWLAFSGSVDRSEGGWLYNTETATILRFTTTAVGELAWSPDGSQIVALDPPTVGVDPNVLSVHIFDMKSALGR